MNEFIKIKSRLDIMNPSDETLLEEIEQWLFENCNDQYYIDHYEIDIRMWHKSFHFNSKRDATLFKIFYSDVCI